MLDFRVLPRFFRNHCVFSSSFCHFFCQTIFYLCSKCNFVGIICVVRLREVVSTVEILAINCNLHHPTIDTIITTIITQQSLEMKPTMKIATLQIDAKYDISILAASLFRTYVDLYLICSNFLSSIFLKRTLTLLFCHSVINLFIFF